MAKKILIVGCPDRLSDTDEITDLLCAINFSTVIAGCGDDIDKDYADFDAAITGKCAECYIKSLGIYTFNINRYQTMLDLLDDIIKWDLGHD